MRIGVLLYEYGSHLHFQTMDFSALCPCRRIAIMNEYVNTYSIRESGKVSADALLSSSPASRPHPLFTAVLVGILSLTLINCGTFQLFINISGVA